MEKAVDCNLEQDIQERIKCIPMLVDRINKKIKTFEEEKEVFSLKSKTSLEKTMEVDRQAGINDLKESVKKEFSPLTLNVQGTYNLVEDEVQKKAHVRKLGSPGIVLSVSLGGERLPIAKSGGPIRKTSHVIPNRRPSLIVPENFSRRSSLTIKRDILSSLRNDDTGNFPAFPAVSIHLQSFLQSKIVKKTSESEDDLEKQYALFSLAVKSDRGSLLERVSGQRVQRNTTEHYIEQDINHLKILLTSLNQRCGSSEMRDKIVNIERHLSVLQQSTGRVAAAAESYGAVQIEQKVSKVLPENQKLLTVILGTLSSGNHDQAYS